jgi:Zn-dependent M28 family amino/carboxypeptidase
VKVQADKEPDQNRFIRSDQYSFVKAGVPAVAFKFGYQKGDPEERVFQHWYNSRYHAVTDDSDQPVDLKAAAQFNDILKDLLLRVADADEAPKWRDESLFKRLATPGL